MKILNKLALTLLLTMPAVIHAGGLGIYVPISLGDTMDVTVTPDFGSKQDYDQTTNFDTSTGFGLTYDSNLGKDELYNYRLGVEWMDRTVDSVSANGNTYNCKNDCDMFRFQVVQTFGFGVLRTEMVRLWVGPRINVGYNYNDTTTGGVESSEVNFELGIAPAVGVNLNFGRWFAVAADLDYRFAYTGGGRTTKTILSNSENTASYSGSNNGASLRLYAIFKFGEDYREGTQFESQEPQQSLESDKSQESQQSLDAEPTQELN